MVDGIGRAKLSVITQVQALMASRNSATTTSTHRKQSITEGAIAAVVDQIVNAFDPEQVIVFGSYAYGQPSPDSDVDLLVVIETERKEAEEAVRICRALEYDFPLDLIVRTPRTLARRLALGDQFLNEVIDRGTVLYARADD
jgi:predicted nucleotidyltransferase